MAKIIKEDGSMAKYTKEQIKEIVKKKMSNLSGYNLLIFLAL